VCDGAFFKGEDVAVIGGGNTAVEEACYLTRFAATVYIVHRRDQFRADRMASERALANPGIVPVWDSVVESIEGDGPLEHLVLKNVKTQETSRLKVAGCFVFVGTSPHAKFVGGLVESGEGGWIVTDADMRTSQPGIFAAGDVRDTGLRQVITAAGDGARAAMSAYHYITEHFS
jgi:thioredoxin reductase (NADPH)